MTAILHFVLITRPDGSILNTYHADSSSEASSLYDQLTHEADSESVKHGYRYELRDRFGVRAARTI